MQREDDRARHRSVMRAVALAWLLIAGIDFFVNGGVLARLWQEPSPFVLPLDDLFLRIPLGYAGLLIWAVLVVWLLVRLDIRDPGAGALFGVKLGLLVSLAGLLGLTSISTIGATLAIVWAVTQIIEFAALGFVGALVMRAPDRRTTLAIISLTLLLVAGGLIAQNIV